MRGSSTGDGYVRLGTPTAPVAAYGSPSRPDALLFVDLDCDLSNARISIRKVRDLPFSQFLGVSRLVVRLPQQPGCSEADREATVGELLAELDRFLPAVAPNVLSSHILVQTIARSADLHDRDGVVDGEKALSAVRRARAVELSALLETNHAVWSPETYHFRLPNGLHASSFVRLADGFSSPRDVEALASWLLPDLRADRGLVFDNRSLTPLAMAVSRLYDWAGLTPGPMTFLEHYLDTQFGIEGAVRESASRGGGVLGVLSVSSAGHTRDRILAAFDRAGQPESRLHVLLDRNVPDDAPVLGRDTAEVVTWLGFNHGPESATRPEHCSSCTDQATRRLVAIDPRYFDGMILPNPTLTMLNPVRAQQAAPFWEACDGAAAVALEHRPSAATKSRRSQGADKSGRMAVFVSLERLLDDDQFRINVLRTVEALLRRPAAEGEMSTPRAALTDIDCVVVSLADAPDGEAGEPFRALLSDLLAKLPRSGSLPDVHGVDHDADPSSWAPSAIGAIKSSERLLIVGAGTVSGYSMQRLLVGCQEHLRGADNPQRLAGLLLHSRPATNREWTTLQNSYGRQLFALFTTLLPVSSPLRLEADTLSAIRRHVVETDTDWQGVLERFIAERTRVCEGDGVEITRTEPAPYAPLLWGLPATKEERATIRQHSLFGHKLAPAAYFGAVGSAVHRERERIADIRGPVWHLFEMPALLRSYYDVLLLATMLRWMEPAEIWWGDQAVTSITAMIDRATMEDQAVLLPELLLAAAHGKVPAEAAEVVETRAVQVLTTPPAGWTDRELCALGAAVLAWRSERASRSRLPAMVEPLPAWPFG